MDERGAGATVLLREAGMVAFRRASSQRASHAVHRLSRRRVALDLAARSALLAFTTGMASRFGPTENSP